MMFLPTPMRKVNVFIGSSDVEPVTIELARLEQFHLSTGETREGTDEAFHWSELADRYTDQKQRLEGLRDILEVAPPPMGPPRQLSPSEDAKDLAEVLQEAEQALKEWQRRKKDTESKIQHLRDLIREARLLAPLKMSMEEIRNPDYLHWVVGTMPRENLETLRFALFETPHEEGWFARRRMQKINVFVHESEVERAAASLVQLQGFHLVRTEVGKWSEEATEWNDLAQTYADQLQRLESLMEALNIRCPSMPPSEQVKPSEEAVFISESLEEAEEAVENLKDRKREAQQEIQYLDNMAREMGFLAPLDIPVEEIRGSQYLHWVAATMPAESLEHLQVTLFRIPAVVVPASVNGERAVVFAVTSRDNADLLDEAVKGLFGEPIPLPDKAGGASSEVADELQKRLEEAKERLSRLEEEGEHLSRRWYEQLLTLWRKARSNAEVAEAVTRFARQGEVFLVSGLVDESAINEVTMTLESATRGRAELEILESTAPRKDVPVEVMLFGIPLVLIPLTTEGNRLLVVAVTSPEHADVLDRAMRGVFLEPVPLLEDLSGIPAEIMPELEQRLDEAESKLEDLEKERERLSLRWGQRLFVLWRQVCANLRVAGAIRRFDRLEGTFLISGWVPEPDVETLVATVETTTAGRADVEILEPRIGGRRRPPTRMRNFRFFRPFEAIVRTFGVPDYHEIDPTPLTALSFTLMYGMMFGDAGHGLLLALLGVWANRGGKGAMRSLGAVLMASGLCAALFGFLYGSFFGREDIVPALWLNPVEDTMDILLASVAGGVAVLSLGFLAFLVNAFRTRAWGDFLFGPGGIAGIWLYWGLVGGVYAAVKGALQGWTVLAVVAIPAVLLFLREPLSRLVMRERPLVDAGPALFSAQAFFELLETIIGDLSNSLSFLRLGAFAVAHASFMRVVFSLAGNSDDPAYWPVVVLGTVVVVGFEGLVVGIQALRLQYYEFFSKFFRGDGSSFKPLRLFETEKS